MHLNKNTRPVTEGIIKGQRFLHDNASQTPQILSCPPLQPTRFLLKALSDGAPATGLNPALPYAAADKLPSVGRIILFYCVHGGQSRDQDCKKVNGFAPTDGITEKIDFFSFCGGGT